MTAMPNELARKRPATVVSRQQPKTIDGRWLAVRGGPTLRGVLTAFALLMMAALFAGFLLSSL